MAINAGVVTILVVPDMAAFTAQLNAGVSGAAAKAGAAGGEAAAVSTAASAESAAVRATPGLTSKFGNMGLLIGGALVVGFAHKAVELAEEVGRQEARITSALGRIGMEELAGSTITSLKEMSAETVTSGIAARQLGANLLSLGQDYFKSLGVAAPQALADITEGLLNISKATGRPMSMLQRSLTQAIFNTPQKALTPLTKLHVITQEQAVTFKEMADRGEIVALRQAELNAVMHAYPGAAEAAATAGDRFQKFLAGIEANAGKFLIPILEKLATLLTSKIGTAFATAAIIGGTLLVAMTALSKIWGFMTNNALARFIARMYQKITATTAETVATEVETVATEESAGANQLAMFSEEELAGAQVTRTGILGALTTAQIGLNAATFGGVAAAAAAGFAIGTLIDRTFDLHTKILNLLGVAENIGTSKEIEAGVDKQISQQIQLEKAYASGTITLDMFNEGVKTINETYGTHIAATYLAEQALSNYTKEGLAEASKHAEELAGSQAMATDTMMAFAQVTGHVVDKSTTVDEQLQAMRDAYHEWGATAAQSVNLVTGSLGDLLQKQNLSARGLAKNLEKQSRDMKKWGADLHKISADGTAGARELVNQLIAAGPAGQQMADKIANATPKVRHRIEDDIGRSLKDSQDIAGSLEKALTGGMDKIAAAIMIANDDTLTFQQALDELDGTTVNPHIVTTVTSQKQHRAAGGPVIAGGSYLVGERGPELFRPSASGTIVPNHELQGSGGGGASVIAGELTLTPDGRAFVHGVIDEREVADSRAGRMYR